MVIGATTGTVIFKADDIRVDFKTVDVARKGERCSVASVDKLHRGDKVFLWVASDEGQACD